jgi:L-amino acid N-acyltransferase YncA
MTRMIASMRPDDWGKVRQIYLEGMSTGHSTFEAEAPDWAKWDADHLSQHRWVARAGDAVLGWVALTPVSGRSVYSGVAEVSLYVAANYRRQGAGSMLLMALIDSAEKAGIWTLQGGIFPENIASIKLFKKHGFREVGLRERLGLMTYGDLAGKWRDVILVERRSKVVGGSRF